MSAKLHDDLILAGYKKHPCYSSRANYMLSKALRRGDGRAFYISVYWHDPLPDLPGLCMHESDVQFKRGGETFNVKLLGDPKQTVEDIESFFNQVYDAMGCDAYDEHHG